MHWAWTNCFLALLMFCSMPGFADRVLDHREPRHIGNQSGVDEWKVCGSRHVTVGNLDNICLSPVIRWRPCYDEKSEMMTPWASATDVVDAMTLTSSWAAPPTVHVGTDGRWMHHNLSHWVDEEAHPWWCLVTVLNLAEPHGVWEFMWTQLT